MDSLDVVAERLRTFSAEREWEQFHDPKNLAMALASEVGELVAEFRWVTNSEADGYSRQEPQRSAIAEELADVGITLLMLCDRVGIDLIDAMVRKIELNRQRYPVERSRGSWQRPGG